MEQINNTNPQETPKVDVDMSAITDAMVDNLISKAEKVAFNRRSHQWVPANYAREELIVISQEIGKMNLTPEQRKVLELKIREKRNPQS